MPKSPAKAGDAGMTRRLQQQHRELGDRRRALELVGKIVTEILLIPLLGSRR
jgi:hypothetical protein